MAWTTPKTWSFKEAPGSASFNEQIRDNLTYLKLSLPPGVIMPYAGASAPEQWLLCDGTAVSRTTYASLFSIIGVLFGSGDGSSTFNLPGLRGKLPIGKKSTDADFDVVGETGGNKAHTHTYSGTTSYNSATDGAQDGSKNVQEDNHAHTYSGTTSGSSTIPFPYLVLNYIIKY